MLAHLLHVVSLAVCQIVAYQLRSLHAERFESVALLGESIGERETYLIGIQGDAMAFLAWRKVGCARVAADPDSRVSGKTVISFFRKAESFFFLQVIHFFLRCDKQLFAVDAKHVFVAFPNLAYSTVLAAHTFYDAVDGITMKTIAADELMEHELRTCRLHHKLLADGYGIAGIIGLRWYAHSIIEHQLSLSEVSSRLGDVLPGSRVQRFQQRNHVMADLVAQGIILQVGGVGDVVLSLFGEIVQDVLTADAE